MWAPPSCQKQPTDGVVPGAEERVEVRPRRRVRRSPAPVAAVADAAEVGRLDAGQVGLERHPAVVPAAVEGGAGEQDRPGMQPRRPARVGQRARPGLLVRDAVEVVVGADAAADLDPQRLLGSEAADVVAVRPVLVARRRLGAGPVRVDDAGAVLEVADLVGEGHVVGVGRPRHPGVLAGRRVHRVERVRRLRAGRRVRVVVDLGEPVGDAGRHRPGLAAGEVVDPGHQTSWLSRGSRCRAGRPHS